MKKLKLLSISIGVIYIWFGALKFFPNLSPAEGLAARTVEFITFDLITEDLGRILLACLEVLIGVGLIIGYKRPIIVKAALCHMACTFIPLFAFPDEAFSQAPFAFTIVGQYIMKNLVIVVALLLLLPGRNDKLQKITS